MTNVGVVLAGGTGSRLLPLTKVLNKHLLAVNGRPMLHWPLRTLAQLGLDRAIVVLGGRSCGEVIEQFTSTYDTGEGVLSLSYVYQEGAGGIPAALREALPSLLASRAERAVVILGDNVFPQPPCDFDSLLRDYPRRAFAVAKPVENASSYGCVPLHADTGEADVRTFVEKPTEPAPNGDVWGAVLGLYVLPLPELPPILEGLRPSARGELEIVDVLLAYARIRTLDVYSTSYPWIDAGDPAGYALANDPAFWRPAPGANWPAEGRS
jgi:glucose-1-phosphate thymidylyltransferase